MRKILLVVFCFSLAGCVTIDSVRATNRGNLLKLSLGMTKQEAMSIMGIQKITASKYFWSNPEFTITNPYRSETLQGKDKVFEVLYYYTDVKKTFSHAITDDELTPLIFDNGKLIGWGWSFMQDNAQKYEIRIR